MKKNESIILVIDYQRGLKNEDEHCSDTSSITGDMFEWDIEEIDVIEDDNTENDVYKKKKKNCRIYRNV